MNALNVCKRNSIQIHSTALCWLKHYLSQPSWILLAFFPFLGSTRSIERNSYDNVAGCLGGWVAVCHSRFCIKTTRGSTEKVQKIGVRRWKFLAESAGTCFTPLTKIKHNSVSLHWNFYTYIQLIGGRLWLQLAYRRLKSSASHASRENTLLRCGKKSEIESGVGSEPATSKGAAYYWVRHYAPWFFFLDFGAL